VATAIVGSRLKFWGSRIEVAREYIDELLDDWPSSELIISGHSPGNGVDIWVEQACKRKGLPFQPYPAAEYTTRAFHARNEEMAIAAADVIAICSADSGVTPGTHDMLTRVLRHRRHVEVVFL
jgi:hypothetical protein